MSPRETPVFLLIEPLHHPWASIKWRLPNVGENHTHALALPSSSARAALSRVGLLTGLRNFALRLPFLVLHSPPVHLGSPVPEPLPFLGSSKDASRAWLLSESMSYRGGEEGVLFCTWA